MESGTKILDSGIKLEEFVINAEDLTTKTKDVIPIVQKAIPPELSSKGKTIIYNGKTIIYNGGNIIQMIAPSPSNERLTTVKMNNTAILYSPFNWAVTSQGAKTINSGAYFKVFFSGTSCRLMTDTTANVVGPFPQINVRIDGGTFTQYTLAPDSPAIIAASGRNNHKHLLEVIVKSTSEQVNRWTKQQNGVTFTGLQVESGTTLTAAARKPFNALIYGDGITEGILVNPNIGLKGSLKETDRNDATQDYSWVLSQTLPIEVGVVGFGGTGITKSGSGGVPPLSTSYQFLWAGQQRSFFNPAPDLIIYNEGTHDQQDITSTLTTIVKAHKTLAPKAKQLLLRPFNGAHASEIKAVADKAGNVTYGDTTGFLDPASDLDEGLYPWGATHVGILAPRLAKLIMPLLPSR